MLAKLTSKLFPKKPFRALILGLDAAGKTTVLYGMALGEVVTTIPTIGFNVETVCLNGSVEAQCWDVGGCDKIRPLYRHYFQATDACVWVVDSRDRERVEESVEECVLVAKELQHECKSDLPFLILANKQDLPNAMTPVEIRARFARALQSSVHEVFPVTACQPLATSGLPEAFNWLGNVLKNRPTSTSDSVQASSATTQDRSSSSSLPERFESFLKRAAADDDMDPHDFLDKFRSFSLPSWDHYTHIRLAFLILTIYGRQKGKDMIFEGIADYIANSKRTTGRSFHTTMTYFWIQIVHFGIRSMGPSPDRIVKKHDGNLNDLDSAVNQHFSDGVSPTDFSRFILFNPRVVDGGLWEEYYTKFHMMSPAARESLALPDKKPLPSIVQRDAFRMAR